MPAAGLPLNAAGLGAIGDNLGAAAAASAVSAASKCGVASISGAALAISNKPQMAQTGEEKRSFSSCFILPRIVLLRHRRVPQPTPPLARNLHRVKAFWGGPNHDAARNQLLELPPQGGHRLAHVQTANGGAGVLQRAVTDAFHLISLAVAGLYDRSGAKSSFLAQIESTIGAEGKNMIQGMIDHAERQPRVGTAAAIIGLGMLLLGALGRVRADSNGDERHLGCASKGPRRTVGIYSQSLPLLPQWSWARDSCSLFLWSSCRDCVAGYGRRPLVGRLRGHCSRRQRHGDVHCDDDPVRPCNKLLPDAHVAWRDAWIWRVHHGDLVHGRKVGYRSVSGK